MTERAQNGFGANSGVAPHGRPDSFYDGGKMKDRTIYVAGAPAQSVHRLVEGGYVDLDGERFYRIQDSDGIPPFLICVVSDSDHWLWASSNGALTAGRRDPDHALFPYVNDDRIHDSQDQTGGKTVLLVTQGERRLLWEPFSPRYEGLYRVSRNLYKNFVGNKLVFEEINHDLSLVFSCAWMTSERFGFVRRSFLTNRGAESLQVELLDGIQNVLPYGVTRRFQLEFSTLVDGYKEAELDQDTGLGLFRLSSIPTDRAEPNEALRATTVWSRGLYPAKRLLSCLQVDHFRHGDAIEQEIRIRGRRGAYFICASFSLAAQDRKDWDVVAEVGQDAAGVKTTLEAIGSGKDLRSEIDADVGRGTASLVCVVAAADGLQAGADALSTGRHFASVLFNVMRGGVFEQGYAISKKDFAAFVVSANREVAHRSASFVEGLPEILSRGQLLSLAQSQNDLDLERLLYEYLPLGFSRRHGDPSRPWNLFEIGVKNARGERALNYQGNWRDIFQNWEALALSFPEYVESMIAKFLDASTADGHNAHHVSRDGFGWDVPNPENPWAQIGYWGDHQIIYLLRILEISFAYHRGALANWLSHRMFTYADVPYRIKPYEALIKDPRRTIEFREDLHQASLRRVCSLGADGRALVGGDGKLVHANLAEKLLVSILAKLFNFVPEAGIWMNTQRPEWNDANNALAGFGVSMVTLCHLRRLLTFCGRLLRSSSAQEIEVSSEVAETFHAVGAVLTRHRNLLVGRISDRDRGAILCLLGEAGTAHRSRIYAGGFSGQLTGLRVADLLSFIDLAKDYADHSIRANRRDDGLYHSYNLLEVVAEGVIAIRRLCEMLEGQVAVLDSETLSTEESADLLDSLRESRLYAPGQNSYLLYPDRELPRFLEKNNISAAIVERSPLLSRMVQRRDERILVRDIEGGLHFNAAFRSIVQVEEALDGLQESEYRNLVSKERRYVLDLYEKSFEHHSFTGRSGAFFKYEGLGCVYWHMVAKLRVAVLETTRRAVFAGEDRTVVERLKRHAREIREGIGVHKSPAQYGAIPTDPYSHTPGFAGAQQPGMTGQVKEDIVSRLAELGVVVADGRLGFCADLVDRTQFSTDASDFRYLDLDGHEQKIGLEEGTLAFTLCQVPIVEHARGPARIEVADADGHRSVIDAPSLDEATSAAVFDRAGGIRRVDVFFGFGN